MATRYTVKFTTQFKKDFKKAEKRHLDIGLLKQVVAKLANGMSLDASMRDHELSGNWLGYRECHITTDWLLVYKVYDDILILTLARTGSHSDIF